MELIVVAHFLVIRDQSFLATGGGGVGRGEGWGGMEGRQRTLVVSQ